MTFKLPSKLKTMLFSRLYETRDLLFLRFLANIYTERIDKLTFGTPAAARQLSKCMDCLLAFLTFLEILAMCNISKIFHQF